MFLLRCTQLACLPPAVELDAGPNAPWVTGLRADYQQLVETYGDDIDDTCPVPDECGQDEAVICALFR